MLRKPGLHSSIRPARPIGHALRQLARWAIAGSLGAASGCGGPYELWTPISCDDAENTLRRASFARDLDYFGLWHDFRLTTAAGDQHQISAYDSARFGVPCESAADPAACMSAFDAATTVRMSCRDDQRCGLFAVATHGDAVTRIDERADLLAWLGSIDNVSKALTLSRWDEKPIRCPSTHTHERGTRYEYNGARFLFGTEWDNCDVQMQLDTWQVSSSGSTTDTDTERLGESGCAVGRRPQGLCPVQRRLTAGTLAGHFAQIAHLEAASVYAFERLARELTRFGAPAALVARAASSALDEVRHAQLMDEQARRFGARAYPVRLSKLTARGLFAFALENAVEGCIHETFGALIAHHQAARALDPQVRNVMRAIARDETRHAELAWQIACWVTPQLSMAQRSELQQAQALALRTLEQAQARPALPPAAAVAIGLPTAAVAQGLVRQLKRLALADLLA